MLRFAASPTGDMHTDTLRIAILNYLVAQQRNESFIVRIEDTDKRSVIEGKDTEIMQILEKFALKHDSVSHQSENLHIHQTLAIRLLEEDKAFICTCTPKERELDHENINVDDINYSYNGKCFDANKEALAEIKQSGIPFVIRIKKPENDIVFHDLIRGNILTTPPRVDSFIILNADGTPSHHFATACDDMLAGIKTIIRSEDHLIDTAKQKHIQTQLGYDVDTIYAHLPVILNEQGQQLSKSDNTSLVKGLFEEGFVPDAIINYLLSLGYSNLPQEIFTLPEAIQWFNIKEISQDAAKFDIDKLRSINSEHLKRIDDKVLSSLFGFADADIGKLAKVYLEEVSTIKELKAKIDPIFTPKDFGSAWGEEMRIMEKIIQEAPMINTFDKFQSYMMKESKLKEENFLMPLRLLLTGAEHGPELSTIYPFIKSYLLEVAS